MTAKISFFHVGNGDMTLIETESGKKLLVDCNIRTGEEFPDVVKQLKEKLSKDKDGRYFVDVFIWSHPDEDHCRGVANNFYLGDPSKCKTKDKILIKGMWTSPIVFRRASKLHKLCDDAKALNTEAGRRIDYFKKHRKTDDGNHILILGKDENGKTDDIKDILIELDKDFSTINGVQDESWSARLLGTAKTSKQEDEEDGFGKNHASLILNHKLTADNKSVIKYFLTGGDAEVQCWEELYGRLKASKNIDWLNYDVLQSPHHCSWHSLSEESWGDAKKAGRKAKPSTNALAALGQAQAQAHIISSSNKILDDENDPPCFGAKDEYEKILAEKKGSFNCVADHKNGKDCVPLVIEIGGAAGKRLVPAAGLIGDGQKPNAAVNRQGGDGYA